MEKRIVFISHIAEERAIAIALKNLVEDAFLGMIEVFVSSDPNSLPLGKQWLSTISHSLKNCAVCVVIASPDSVKRPWINFEAGAGWIRDVPVIPLCHSGMTHSTLPAPLSTLQAANANEEKAMQLILPVLATAIGCVTPAVNFTEFVDKVREFESLNEQRKKVIEEQTAALTDGLAEHEVDTIFAIGDLLKMPSDWVPVSEVHEQMSRWQYRSVATALALRLLEKRELIKLDAEIGSDFRNQFAGVQFTSSGWRWLEENQNSFSFKKKRNVVKEVPTMPPDDIPF